MTKVVFPSFREQEYSQFEMRQLVSALELRFQSIETEIQQSVIPDTDPVGGEFAPLVHTHVEADITDLDHTSSIFELDDVNGTPSLNDILVWDGGQFLPQAAGGVTLMLNDLTDVNAPGPADEQVLTFDIGTLRWIAADPPAGIDTLVDLTDTDLTGQNIFDMLYNATGSEWRDTAGQLQWNPVSGYLQIAQDFSINWVDSTGGVSTELLHFQGVAQAAQDISDSYEQEDTGTLSTTSSTFVDVDAVNRIFDVSAMTDGDDYFMYCTTGFANSISNAPIGNDVQLELSSSQVTGSFGRIDESSARGFDWQFGFQDTIASAGDDYVLQYRQFDSSNAVESINWNAFGINVSSFAGVNYRYSEDTTGILAGVNPTFVNTAASVTHLSGTWLVFVNAQFNGTSSGRVHYLAINDGTTDIVIDSRESTASSNSMCLGGVYILNNIPAGTLTASVSTDVTAAQCDRAMIAAFRINSFTDFDFTENLTQQTGFSSGDNTILSSSFTAANTATYMAIGYALETWPGSGFSGATRIEVDINTGGAVSRATCTERETETNSNTAGRPILPISTFAVTASDTIDIDMIHTAAPSQASNTIEACGMVVFQLETAGATSEVFTAGDESARTDIDGSTIRYTAPTDANYIERTVAQTGTVDEFVGDETDSTAHEVTWNISSSNTGDRGYRWRVNNIDFLEIDERFDLLSLFGGREFRVYSSGNVDYVELGHDGTNAFHEHLTTTHHDFLSLAGNVRIRDGAGLQIFDATDTDSLTMAHDGTDFDFTWVNTGIVTFGAVGSFYNFLSNVDVTADVFITGGNQLQIFDASAVDSVTFGPHNGTDFLTTFVNTSDWNIDGLSGDFQIDAQDFRFRDTSNNIYFEIQEAGGPAASSRAYLNVPLALEAGVTNRMSLYIEEMAAAVTDFANFGQWWVRNDTPNVAMFTDDAGNDMVIGQTGYQIIQDGTVTDASIRWDGSDWVEEDRVRISSAGVLTILDSTLADSHAMSHDGTDFISTFTGTTDWQMTGLNSIILNSTLQMAEQSTSNSPAAGYGEYWVRDDVPSVPMFTNDIGEDFRLDLVSGGGASLSGIWQYDDTTTEADPGAGNFRTDNNTVGSVTEIYLSNESKPGFDATNIINLLTAGDQIYIQNSENSTQFILATIDANVDNGAWNSLEVTLDNSNANFTDGAEFGIALFFGGTGAPGPALPVPTVANSMLRSNGVDNWFEVTNATLTTAGTMSLVGLNATADITVTNASADVRQLETGATADEGNWILRANADSWRLQTASDAAPNTGAANVMQVERTGTSPTTVDWNGTLFRLRTGMDLQVFGPGNTEFATLTHTDSNAQLTSSAATNIQFLSGGGFVNVVTGGVFRVWDAGNTDRIEISADGTDVNLTGVSVTDMNVSGFTDMRLITGMGLVIQDATNADATAIRHDGTDVNWSNTGTTDINVTGISGFNVVNYNFDVDQTVGAGQDNFVLTYDDGTGLISLEAATGGGGTIGGSIATNQVAVGAATADEIEGSSRLVWNDLTLTVNAEANSQTSLDIGEPSTLRGDNADGRILLYGEQGGAITAASIRNSGSNFQFAVPSGNNVQWTGVAPEFQLRDGATLRIFDAGDTDIVSMSHDGTDFNIVTTNTADINIGENGTRLVLPSSTDQSLASTDHPFQVGAQGAQNIRIDNNEIQSVTGAGAAGDLNLQTDGGQVTIGAATAGTFRMREKAAAAANAAAFGEFWVRNDAPNTPMFTDDNGTDFDLTAGTITPPIVLLDNEEIQFGTGTDTTMEFNPAQNRFEINSTAGIGFRIADANDTGIGTVSMSVWRLEDQCEFQMITGTANETVDFEWNGSNYETVFGSAVTQWSIQGLGTSDSIRFQDGVELRLYDSTDSVYLGITQDTGGAEYNQSNAADTHDFHVVGVSKFVIDNTNVRCANTNFRVEDSLSSIYTEFDRQTSELRCTPSGAGNGFWFRTGTEVRVYDNSNTDYLEFSHNGTNAFIQCVNGDLFFQDTSGSTTAIFRDNGNHSILHGTGGTGITTIDYTASGNTSSCSITGASGTGHDIGFNDLQKFNDNVSDTLEAGHAGLVAFKDTSTARTLTLAASGDTDFPVDAMTTVINAFTSGNYTITEGASTTLYYLDGSTRTDTAGGCTVGPGGVANIWRESTTVYYIWGTGITP